MAKLVTKFKYLKPNERQNIGGYAKYIATREGVEKIDESYKLAQSTQRQHKLIEKILRDFPDAKEMLEYEDFVKEPTVGNASEFITRALEDNACEVMQAKTYADYIATRPRAQRFGRHGLFTDDGVEVKLNEVSDGLNQYGGNVWTVIISLRREDAQRLGYDSGERWRDMLRTQTAALAEYFKIPMDKLKWYAAFHNESHHPHVHLMVYAEEGVAPYLSKQGVAKLRSAFAADIFAQDLLCVYEKQTQHRDAIRAQSREWAAGIVSQINNGVYENTKLEEQLTLLAGRLSKTKGKKVYGYLKADVKAIVNRIVGELAADKRIAALYDLWYEQKEEALRTYTQILPERIPLADNPEFKSIKNMVIQEAMRIASGTAAFDDAADEPPPETADEPEPEGGGWDGEPTEPDMEASSYSHNSKRSKKTTWWTSQYKRARNCLYGIKDTPSDFPQALALLREEARKGNGFAMHDLGKMYLSGLGCEKNEAQAQEWFAKAFHAFMAEETRAKKKDYLQYRIGKLFSFGYGVEQDDSKAAAWYEKAVAEDNPFAAYSLGSLYRRGQGVEQDEAKAFYLYSKAATHKSNPNAYAAYELGRMCRDGIGTKIDRAASEAWYRQAYQGFLAIEQSMADDKLYYRLGQMNLTGTGTEVNVTMAKTYFEKAAKLDNPDALYGLGKLHLKRDSADYNPQTAIQYLLEAAKKGHEYAQYTLGRLYLQGREVPKNVSHALWWLEKAAVQKNQYAEYLLGKTYLTGEDVEQNPSRAEELLRRSTEQGNCRAQYTLGKALLEGIFLHQNIPEALRLLTEAAGKNDVSACYLLGKLLYKGEFVPQDLPQALAYLALAAENGNAFAGYQLGRLYLFGRDIPQDYGKAIAYLTASAGHGNPYAAQLLHSIRSSRNYTAAMGAFRLLGQISRAIQHRIEDERKGGRTVNIDRKLKRKIDEKKEAQGLKTQ